MSFVHGKSTVVTLSGLSGPASGSHDISAFLTSATWDFGADVHDTTTFGKNDHVWATGLKTGKFSVSGIYDSSLPNAPWFVLQQSNGQTATVLFKPEGTGTGKPSHSFSAVLTNYSESNPVADMVTFQADWNVSDSVTSSIQ
jgi:hypothetical protein